MVAKVLRAPWTVYGTGRLHIAGGCYHLMGRGLERRNIFDSDEDKEGFIARVALEIPGTQYQTPSNGVVQRLNASG